MPPRTRASSRSRSPDPDEQRAADLLVDRQRSYACIHPDTYKYFFRVDAVLDVWRRLEERYGPIQRSMGFKTIQIDAERFVFRSVVAGNPITVIRKRRCTSADVSELHHVMGCGELAVAAREDD